MSNEVDEILSKLKKRTDIKDVENEFIANQNIQSLLKSIKFANLYYNLRKWRKLSYLGKASAEKFLTISRNRKNHFSIILGDRVIWR